jgi:hypothetical protein
MPESRLRPPRVAVIPLRMGGRGVRAVLGLALLVPHLTGCYQHVPASPATLTGGTEVSLGITDEGRVALADQVGPGIRRLEGRVLEITDTSLVLALTRVNLIDLDIAMQRDGERVEVARSQISDLRERQLSRSRTWLAVGGAVAAVLSLFLIALSGFGGDDPIERPGPGDGDGT